MKKIISKSIAALLVLAGYASCQENQMLDNGKDSWVCKPEPQVTITLTFDSGQVYVNTSPKDLVSSSTPSGKRYLFNDGAQYHVRNDTLFFINPDPNAPAADYGFIQTMLSSDSMKLQSFGVGFVAIYVYVTDYLFERTK